MDVTSIYTAEPASHAPSKLTAESSRTAPTAKELSGSSIGTVIDCRDPRAYITLGARRHAKAETAKGMVSPRALVPVQDN